MCIGWEENGDFLATGSVDAVRIWNVKTGHAVHKLMPGRAEVNKPTVVWCLTIADDFTIITGDSRYVNEVSLNLLSTSIIIKIVLFVIAEDELHFGMVTKDFTSILISPTKLLFCQFA